MISSVAQTTSVKLAELKNLKESFIYFSLALTSLITIVNPLGTIPFYSSLTEGAEATVTRAVALRASLAAFAAMLFFAISGKFLFDFFNVSIDSLRVVGGVLFFITGYDMLQGKDARTKLLTASEKMSLQDVNIKAITPLAIPLICGPGTITVMTVMMQESSSLLQRALLFIAAALVSLLTYFTLLGSKRITLVIGESGQKVFFRLMGLILMMISVEFFFTGIKPYIKSMLSQ
ncbi:MAG: NAAT family transporter [Bdellovibrionales bacterium]|nr:NAAT family transporter [Bdellovibrionales bacterium]